MVGDPQIKYILYVRLTFSEEGPVPLRSCAPQNPPANKRAAPTNVSAPPPRLRPPLPADAGLVERVAKDLDTSGRFPTLSDPTAVFLAVGATVWRDSFVTPANDPSPAADMLLLGRHGGMAWRSPRLNIAVLRQATTAPSSTLVPAKDGRQPTRDNIYMLLYLLCCLRLLAAQNGVDWNKK